MPENTLICTIPYRIIRKNNIFLTVCWTIFDYNHWGFGQTYVRFLIFLFSKKQKINRITLHKNFEKSMEIWQPITLHCYKYLGVLRVSYICLRPYVRTYRIWQQPVRPSLIQYSHESTTFDKIRTHGPNIFKIMW